MHIHFLMKYINKKLFGNFYLPIGELLELFHAYCREDDRNNAFKNLKHRSKPLGRPMIAASI